jgi:hypothetical protein
LSQDHYLAQANIARARASLTDPVMAGFVEQLEYINSVADGSPGFVWRFQTEEGDATAVRVFSDPLIIFNMSVWESVEALFDYAFRSDHRGPLGQRHEWFEKLDRPHSVLWWIPSGEVPTVSDAQERLDLLWSIGPSPAAFTFPKLFGPEGHPLARSSRIDRGCGV